MTWHTLGILLAPNLNGYTGHRSYEPWFYWACSIPQHGDQHPWEDSEG